MRDTLPLRVRFGAFELDVTAGALSAANATGAPFDNAIILPQQPLRLLLMLIEGEGALVTREEIRQKFWPNDTIVEFDHSINVAIGKLRKALGDSADAPQYIATVASRGYRLMVPVERIAVAEDSPEEAVAHGAGGLGAAVRLQPTRAALIGRIVSHYRVLDIIGGGGMGVVYRAEDLKLGRRVAMKFLPEEMAADAPALQRFEREARTASLLNHPNICTIYEFGEHEGHPFLVMELLQGEALRDRLAAAVAKALPLDELLDIALQISGGLQAAHEQGIVHRDIKPANIVFTNKGACKILDFGLARLEFSSHEAEKQQGHRGQGHSGSSVDCFDTGLSRTGSAMGTAGYMSPEQVRGEKLDARSDLFSFGLVLYEMASGRRAFSGETVESVHEAIVNQVQVPARHVNPALPAELDQIISSALEKDRERRYQSAAEMRADLERVRSGKQERQRWIWVAYAAFLVVLAVAAALYWRAYNRPKLTDKDTIVLGDFDNRTGDLVFDDALKQALSIQLEQSPFLDLVSESKVNETLKLMEHSAGDRLTPPVAREVCLRTGSKAVVTGSIAQLGSEYVVGLKTVNCGNEDVLAQAQESAASKDGVLKALGAAAVTLRGKLGEPHPSIEKYATPLEDATTSSLEALKAYSLGQKTKFAKGDTAALPFYKRAVELDPNFAMAYLAMSIVYHNMNEVTRSADNARKAFELRENVSEREKFQIEARYYTNATGELEKAAETFRLWQQTYPKSDAPHRGLAFVSANLGLHEQGLQQRLEALRLEPNNGINYGAVGVEYVALNRLDDADAIYKLAEDRKLESEDLPLDRYVLAFLKGDTAQMAKVAAGATGKPGTEDLVLASQADTEGWYGRLKNARQLTQHAMDSAERNDAKETAAIYQAAAALREVEAGNREQARADADAAVKLGPTRDVQAMAALALARAGDTSTAEQLAAELDRKLPLDTMAQRYWLPMVHAAVALEHKDPNRAVEQLRVTSPMDLSVPAEGALWPVYLRGDAYLMMRDGKAAAREFQKFVDHYGVAANCPWGALARLGLARAHALDIDSGPAARDKARAAYQNFLTIWKDADPDITIYRQAKAEYATLL